jgi:hypothetical protein
MPIIDPLPFTLDRPELAKMLRLRAGSRNAEQVERLIAEAEQLAQPRALYRLCFIESRTDDTISVDGITFTSRVLRVNLGDLQRFFAFVVTSGRECEAWAESFDDVLLRFYADTVNQAVLHSAMAGFVAQLAEAYALQQTSVMNPGSLPEWPISQQKTLFALLGDVEAEIGVELKPSFLMIPTKSVSGILFPTEETFASCQLCPRLDCPNRRAPYDAGLFQRKYDMASTAAVVAASGEISGH